LLTVFTSKNAKTGLFLPGCISHSFHLDFHLVTDVACRSGEMKMNVVFHIDCQSYFV
jgi:hypothetical protein